MSEGPCLVKDYCLNLQEECIISTHDMNAVISFHLYARLNAYCVHMIVQTCGTKVQSANCSQYCHGLIGPRQYSTMALV